ncbi:MAG TPA: ion channel [Solirubrobacteraceae bacterium]|nr:ion channel [Solirubrobacteraceae bacterium]
MLLFIMLSRRLAALRHRRLWALFALGNAILLVGAALFAVTQHDSFWLALYWAITTATTVGYGDVLPKNTIGHVIASVVMLTTIPIVGAIFGLLAGATAVRNIRRILGMDTRLPSEPYTVIYGLDPVVPRVLEELCRRDTAVVLVAPQRPPGAPEAIAFIAGDPTDERVIARSKPAEADRALIACEQDADTMIVAVTLHTLAPKIRSYALTDSPRVARALGELGVTHTLSADELVGHTVAKSLETPEAGNLLLSLVDATNYRLSEQIVDEDLRGRARTLSAARSTPGTLVLGIARDGKVELGVDNDPELNTGDRLIVLHQA